MERSGTIHRWKLWGIFFLPAPKGNPIQYIQYNYSLQIHILAPPCNITHTSPVCTAFSFSYAFKLNSYSIASVFYRFVTCAFPFFEVKSVLPIDRYQNATSKAISLHDLKKVQLQERYTLLTQDSFGHLKTVTLCMSILSLVVAMESEWQRDNSSQSDKKTLEF